MTGAALPLEGTLSIATRDGRRCETRRFHGWDGGFDLPARREVDFEVKRLGTHAPLALWCGDSELIGALTWFEGSRKNRDRYLVSYNRIAEGAIRAADLEACWWPFSPSPGPLSGGMPGETMTLSFTPGEAMQSPVIRDLHSSSSAKRD